MSTTILILCHNKNKNTDITLSSLPRQQLRSSKSPKHFSSKSLIIEILSLLLWALRFVTKMCYCNLVKEIAF
jgi:hypothetical protein